MVFVQIIVELQQIHIAMILVLACQLCQVLSFEFLIQAISQMMQVHSADALSNEYMPGQIHATGKRHTLLLVLLLNKALTRRSATSSR